MIPLPTMSNVYKTYSRNLGQRSILARKGNFFEKRAPKIYPSHYLIPFPSVLHRNKGLYNFCIKGAAFDSRYRSRICPGIYISIFLSVYLCQVSSM